MSSLKIMENGPQRIEDAIDFINKGLSEEDLGMLVCRPCTDSFVASPDQLTSGTSKPLSTGYPPDPTWTTSSNENETKVLSELIAHCVATLLVIQVIIFMSLRGFCHGILLQNYFLVCNDWVLY